MVYRFIEVRSEFSSFKIKVCSVQNFIHLITGRFSSEYFMKPYISFPKQFCILHKIFSCTSEVILRCNLQTIIMNIMTCLDIFNKVPVIHFITHGTICLMFHSKQQKKELVPIDFCLESEPNANSCVLHVYYQL